jgi:hypothetical protein
MSRDLRRVMVLVKDGIAEGRSEGEKRGKNRKYKV